MSLNKRIVILSQQYGVDIPVKDICQRYFSCSIKTANERIRANTFPIPAFRTTATNSGDYFVKAEDLAALIEARYNTARTEWEQANKRH